MKESTHTQEQDENKKKMLSTAQKEELINPETVTSTTPSSSNNNNEGVRANFPATTPAIIKEPTSNIAESKISKRKKRRIRT
jgi:hypothetical protein